MSVQRNATEISLKKYENSDLYDVIEFYQRSYLGDLKRKSECFQSITANNPFKNSTDNYIFIFYSGKLVGYWGIMPMRFYLNGKPFMGLFSQEALVDPSYRGLGFATNLLREVMGSRRFLVSLWHNEKIFSKLTKEGWTNIGSFKPLKKIYRFDSLIRLKLRSKLLDRLLEIFPKMYLINSVYKNKKSNRYSIETVQRFGKEFDDFFLNLVPSLNVISDRTSATLNWKYIDIPYKQYQVLVAREGGKLCSYIVIRIEEQEHNIKKGVITDLLCYPSKPEALACLIQRCDEIFIRNQVDFSVCLTSVIGFKKVLNRYGYFQSKKKLTDSLLIYNEELSPDRKTIVDIGNWYLTYGESDGDIW